MLLLVLSGVQKYFCCFQLLKHKSFFEQLTKVVCILSFIFQVHFSRPQIPHFLFNSWFTTQASKYLQKTDARPCWNLRRRRSVKVFGSRFLAFRFGFSESSSKLISWSCIGFDGRIYWSFGWAVCAQLYCLMSLVTSMSRNQLLIMRLETFGHFPSFFFSVDRQLTCVVFKRPYCCPSSWSDYPIALDSKEFKAIFRGVSNYVFGAGCFNCKMAARTCAISGLPAISTCCLPVWMALFFGRGSRRLGQNGLVVWVGLSQD